MSLRFRIALLFLIATFVPFAGLGVLVQSTTVEERRAEHRQLLERRVRSADQRLARQDAEDRRALSAMCEHDLVIDRLILDLATGRFGPSQEQSLVSLLPSMMQGRRFDVLFLLDARSGSERGKILGAGHDPERAGAARSDLLDAIARGDRAFVDDVRVVGEEGGRDVRALLQGCLVERDGVSLGVVGGRVLSEDFAEALMGDSAPVVFRLSDISSDQATDALGGGEVVASFANARGEARISFTAHFDDAPLEAEIAALEKRALGIAGVAFLIAIGLSLLLSWSLSRPLAQLAEAARRVGQGDLESQMDVRGGAEIGETMTAFNEMTRELQSTRQKLLRAERIAAWREVARRIAHEIKNPLQPIQMEIETMRKMHQRKHPAFDEEFGGSTQLILDEVRRLDSMVTEFSRFARLPRPKPKTIDVAEVLGQAVDLHSGRSSELAAALGSVELRADREQLMQVFVNLIQNACDAAEAIRPEGQGRVRASLHDEGESVEIRIEDNGPGIPEKDRLRVFEPYFTTKSEGTGLGLAIVHRIVGDHAGTLDVEDGIDGGAAFVIRLPKSGPPEAIAASLADTDLPLG